MAEAACELADATAGYGWRAAAADDALVAIDTLAAALVRIDPEVGEALAAVTAATATATARPCPGLPVDTGGDGAVHDHEDAGGTWAAHGTPASKACSGVGSRASTDRPRSADGLFLEDGQDQGQQTAAPARCDGSWLTGVDSAEPLRVLIVG
ncbi:hypothetical protein [Streptomyces sp. TLI_105]|uniref:hypothetical protein n=1 Tax=Streptomyces sp. TLI_105 TaxID=1881019 RepID=UPI000B875CCC|nr:hypothetical protein [Streptomyces sp. TLI_105]